MFPIRDDNPRRGFPIVVFLLILINVFIFGFQLTLEPADFEDFIQSYAMIPARDFVSPFLSVSFLDAITPFFTSMFMHGGFLHIFLNLWSFWIFGDNVELSMGRIRFIGFYLLCGLGAALAHCYFYPTSNMPVVGASGAISGVMGAYLFLFPKAQLQMVMLLIFYPIFFKLPAVVFLVFWFMGQFASGTASLSMAGQAGFEDVGGVAFLAHIGGFVTGILLLPIFKLGKK